MGIGLFGGELSAAESARSLFLILGPALRPGRATVLEGEIQVGSTWVSLEGAVVALASDFDGGKLAFAGPTLDAAGTWTGPRRFVIGSWTCG